MDQWVVKPLLSLHSAALTPLTFGKTPTPPTRQPPSPSFSPLIQAPLLDRHSSPEERHVNLAPFEQATGSGENKSAEVHSEFSQATASGLLSLSYPPPHTGSHPLSLSLSLYETTAVSIAASFPPSSSLSLCVCLSCLATDLLMSETKLQWCHCSDKKLRKDEGQSPLGCCVCCTFWFHLMYV